MSLNCWIIKSHTITFAGILNSTIQGKSLSCFLLLRCLWASERQQEGTSPEELFINAPVISFDLHFFWKKKKKEALFFSSLFQALHVCAGRPGFLLFYCPSRYPSVLPHSYCKKHLPLYLWLFLNPLSSANTLSTLKRKLTGDSAQCRMFSENSLGSLRVLKFSVCWTGEVLASHEV